MRSEDPAERGHVLVRRDAINLIGMGELAVDGQHDSKQWGNQGAEGGCKGDGATARWKMNMAHEKWTVSTTIPNALNRQARRRDAPGRR